ARNQNADGACISLGYCDCDNGQMGGPQPTICDCGRGPTAPWRVPNSQRLSNVATRCTRGSNSTAASFPWPLSLTKRITRPNGTRAITTSVLCGAWANAG